MDMAVFGRLFIFFRQKTKFSAFFFASSQLLRIFATLKYTEAVQSADPRSAFFVPQTIQVLTEYCTVSSIGDDSEVFAFV